MKDYSMSFKNWILSLCVIKRIRQAETWTFLTVIVYLRKSGRCCHTMMAAPLKDVLTITLSRSVLLNALCFSAWDLRVSPKPQTLGSEKQNNFYKLHVVQQVIRNQPVANEPFYTSPGDVHMHFLVTFSKHALIRFTHTRSGDILTPWWRFLT